MADSEGKVSRLSPLKVLPDTPSSLSCTPSVHTSHMQPLLLHMHRW